MTAKVALMHSIARQKWWAWHKLFLFCYIPRNCSAAEKETHNQYRHSSRYHRRVISPYTEVQTSEEVCSDWIDVLMKILRHVICQSWDSTQVVRKKVRVMMKISLDMKTSFWYDIWQMTALILRDAASLAPRSDFRLCRLWYIMFTVDCWMSVMFNLRSYRRGLSDVIILSASPLLQAKLMWAASTVTLMTVMSRNGRRVTKDDRLPVHT